MRKRSDMTRQSVITLSSPAGKTLWAPRCWSDARVDGSREHHLTNSEAA